MAISGFGRGRGDDMDGSMSAPASTSSSSSSGGFGNLTAFIDQGSQFEGKLSFKDTVRIDGGFSGEISSENTLIVGETGVIEAQINSSQVVVSGTVKGDINASRQVMLHKSAKVDGDIQTPSITIEEGAVFNGRLSMSKTAGASANDKSRGNLKAVEGEKSEASSK